MDTPARASFSILFGGLLTSLAGCFQPVGTPVEGAGPTPRPATSPGADSRPALVRVAQVQGSRVEVYHDPLAFRQRLQGAVRTVDFDDLPTDHRDPRGFQVDRYRASHGLRIQGARGQYVGRSFNFPKDYVPTSPPNMYAPGPRPGEDPIQPRGGNSTTVTFFNRQGRPAQVAGFGLMFLDADHPQQGPSSLTIYDAEGRKLTKFDAFHCPHGKHIFVGVVTVSRAFAPVPLIAQVRIVNGSQWAGVDGGDGVTLDDFVFGLPVAAGSEPRSNHDHGDR